VITTATAALYEKSVIGTRPVEGLRLDVAEVERELDAAFDQGNCRAAMRATGRLDALRRELATAERQNGGTPAGGNAMSAGDIRGMGASGVGAVRSECQRSPVDQPGFESEPAMVVVAAIGLGESERQRVAK
jgi:hypothetical protein